MERENKKVREIDWGIDDEEEREKEERKEREEEKKRE